MIFTKKKISEINKALEEKKRVNRINNNVIGIGVNIKESIGKTSAYINNWEICEIEDIGRLVEELTMLKEAIKEETGIVL